MNSEDKSQLIQSLLNNDIKGFDWLDEENFGYSILFPILTQAWMKSNSLKRRLSDTIMQEFLEKAKSSPQEDNDFYRECLKKYNESSHYSEVYRHHYLIGIKVSLSRIGVDALDISDVFKIVRLSKADGYHLFNALVDIGLDVYQQGPYGGSPINIVFSTWPLNQIKMLDQKININYNFSSLAVNWLSQNIDKYDKIIGMSYFVNRGMTIQHLMNNNIVRALDDDRHVFNYDFLNIVHLAQYAGASIYYNSVMEYKSNEVDLYLNEYMNDRDDHIYYFLLQVKLMNLVAYRELLKHYSPLSLKGITLTTIIINDGDLSTHPSEYVDLELDYPLLDMNRIKSLVDQELAKMI